MRSGPITYVFFAWPVFMFSYSAISKPSAFGSRTLNLVPHANSVKGHFPRQYIHTNLGDLLLKNMTPTLEGLLAIMIHNHEVWGSTFPSFCMQFSYAPSVRCF